MRALYNQELSYSIFKLEVVLDTGTTRYDGIDSDKSHIN